MIKEIELEKGVKLIAGENIVNNCTYVSLTFAGGYASEKYFELAHLVEHIFLGFDYLVDGKIQPNKYMGNMRADARTKDDRVEFTFCVTSEEELKEKLDVLIHCFNDVVITKEDLEKEKITIFDELYQDGSTLEYIEKVKNTFKKLKVKDVQDYIKTNFNANNLTICTIGKLGEGVLIEDLNNLIFSLPQGKRISVPSGIGKQRCEIGASQTDNKIAQKVKVCYLTDLNITGDKERILYDLLRFYLDNFRVGIKKILRREKRLVYRTQVFGTSYKNADLIVTAYSKEENLEQVIEETEKYISTLAANGLKERDLEFIKQVRIDFLKSRPIHITENIIRDIFDDYSKTQNSKIDKQILSKFIDENKESFDNYNPKDVETMIKDISSVNLHEFNEFVKNFFKNAEIVAKIDGNQKDL